MDMKRKGLLLCVGVVLVMLAVQGCSTPKATLSQYEQIENGMTEQEVVQIMGSPGEALMSMSLPAGTSKVLQWKNSETSGLFVGFSDGKVISKSQAGLK